MMTLQSGEGSVASLVFALCDKTMEDGKVLSVKIPESSPCNRPAYIYLLKCHSGESGKAFFVKL